MEGKGKFHIPSFEEMDDDDGPQIKPSSLFQSYKSNSETSPVQKDKQKTTHDWPTSAKTVNQTMIHDTGTSHTSGSSTNLKSSSLRTVSTSNTSVKLGESKSSSGQLPKFNLTKSSCVVKKSVSEDKEEGGKSSSDHTKKTETLGTKTSETESTKSEKQEIVSISPPRPGKNALIVSPKQRGNPILKFIRNVPWEFGDIVPDYVMGKATCALFLSLRYHHLNPNYIHERLKQLGHSYDLRVMLVQVDVKDPHHSLKELSQICILADCTLILAFSPDEAGRYLETYKAYESKPADLIMERTEGNYLAQLTDFLTSAKKVNKTDSMTLLSTFGSVNNMVKASGDDLSLCPGFGPQKAKRLHDVFHQPFLKAKRKKTTESPAKGDQPQPGTSKDG